MKLKIISDGTQLGTRIVNEETGDVINNCVKLKIEIGMDLQMTNCELTLIKIPFEYTGESILKNISIDKPISTEDKLKIFDNIVKHSDY